MALPTMATGLVVGQYVVPGGSATPRAAKGIIEFTADVPYNPIPTATPNAYTIVPMRVIGVLDDEGFVCTPIAEGSTAPGGQGVRLPATNVAQGSVENWTWTATPKFTPPEGVRISSAFIKPFTFAVPAGKTTDLAVVAKVPASTGLGTEQIVALAAATARSAVETAAYAAEVKNQALANDSGVAAFLTGGPKTSAALRELLIQRTGINPELDPTATSYVFIPAGATKSGVKIRNDAQNYALRIDQTDGDHDAVNITANVPGNHTPLGILSGNTGFSTVKVTNNAKQEGGMVIAAIGNNPERTTGIIGTENYGSGPGYLATTANGAPGVAFQANYVGDQEFTGYVFWGKAKHRAGDLFRMENDTAHTSGSTLRIIENNPNTTVPLVFIDNKGTGPNITAPNFEVRKDGRVRALTVENFTSYTNASLGLAATGASVTREVADANPIFTVRNQHGNSTGDLLSFSDRGDILARIDRNGTFISKRRAAPAELKNNEFSFWFDTAANALKITARDYAGTLKTGTIPLA